jgi:hypothetical protein
MIWRGSSRLGRVAPVFFFLVIFGVFFWIFRGGVLGLFL